jgi:hypothetical protein
MTMQSARIVVLSRNRVDRIRQTSALCGPATQREISVRGVAWAYRVGYASEGGPPTTRHVWVIKSTGLPEAAVGQPAKSSGARTAALTARRRFGLRPKEKNHEPPAPAPSPTHSFPLGWDGTSATCDGPDPENDFVPQVSKVPEIEWLDAEPAWLDPNGPRSAQGPDPSWTIHRGTLVGGPLRWVLQRKTDSKSQWAFLSVSGQPTADEFADTIAAIGGWDVANGIVHAIRASLPDCISEPDDTRDHGRRVSAVDLP